MKKIRHGPTKCNGMPKNKCYLCGMSRILRAGHLHAENRRQGCSSEFVRSVFQGRIGMKNRKIRTAVLAAVFAAVICLLTLLHVPLAIGYANLGDVGVLLSGFLFGPAVGAVSSAVGSSLADLIAGYPQYIPGTFIIKAALAALSAVILSALRDKIKYRPLPRIIAAAAGEILMVLGYFVYEAFVLSYGVGGALAGVTGNIMQGILCAAVAVVIYPAIRKIFK